MDYYYGSPYTECTVIGTINGNVRKRGHFGSDLAHTTCSIDINNIVIVVIIIIIRSIEYASVINLALHGLLPKPLSQAP